MSKKALPEHNIDSGDIVDIAKSLVETRSKIAELQTREKQQKKELAEKSDEIRESEEENGNYIGIVRITGGDMPPVRVEFRIQNGALDTSQEQQLDELFKAARPQLWGREKLVTAVADPAKLVQDLTEQGRNPWDYLEISVKKGMDRVVSEWSDAVVAQEALVPREGFLATLTDLVNVISDNARKFLKEYLVSALKTVPVVGSRGKA